MTEPDPTGMSVAAVPQAQAVIERLRYGFVAQAVPAAAVALTGIARELRNGDPDAARIMRVHRIARDLGREGSAFGHPLIAGLGGRLAALADDVRGTVDPEAIDACVAALRQVVEGPAAGAGDRTGPAVLAALDERLSALRR